MEAEVDAINYVNLGIGINVNAHISQCEEGGTSLRAELGREVSRREFLSTLLTEIGAQQTLLSGNSLLEEWKILSVTLNREVRIVTQGEEIVGWAVDIDASGALILRSEDGSLRSAIAGDCIHLVKEALNTNI